MALRDRPGAAVPCAAMTTFPHLDELADELRHSGNGAVVLTGAGVSVASGVPSFRGGDGLWARYDPAVYASIDGLRADPARVWCFFRELRSILDAAQPNPAHIALAGLERQGAVAQVVTQNIDGLHQRAGSRRVVELHGSDRCLHCLECGRRHPRSGVEEPTEATVPRCPDCRGVLKPDVVLFGEDLPVAAFRHAEHAMRHADLLLVVGTSAEVYPAARLPGLARSNGARIWEINPTVELSHADGRVRGRAEDVLPELARRLRPAGAWRQARQLLGGLGARGWFAD